jgi:hypothetical protein
LQSGRDRFVRIIQFEYFFRTELDAYTATLAPFPIDDVLFEFRFCHKGYLVSSATRHNVRVRQLITARKAQLMDIMPLFNPVVYRKVMIA